MAFRLYCTMRRLFCPVEVMLRRLGVPAGVGSPTTAGLIALYVRGLILARLGLTLHPTKTRVVFVGDGGDGFDVLGFHCRTVVSWRQRGRRYAQRSPSQRAMQAVRGRIKAITAPRHRLPEPIGPIVDELNRLLRGWGAYFRVGNSTRKFQQVDDYVRERLALFLRKKAGRRGRQREWYGWAFMKTLGSTS